MTRPGEQAAIEALRRPVSADLPMVYATDIVGALYPVIAAAVLRDAAAEMEHRDWSAAAAVLHRLANQQETP